MKKSDVRRLVKGVEDYCTAQGLRFTDPRRHVLEIIASSKKPIGAYDVLSQLGAVLKNPKPPTAYRAIEFLQEHGFVHRIESLNAYVTCHAGHKHKGSQFMVCDTCGRVIEAHLCALPENLEQKALDAGFVLSFWSTEIHGTCSQCVRA